MVDSRSSDAYARTELVFWWYPAYRRRSESRAWSDGCSEGELVGMKIGDFVHPDFRTQVATHFRRVVDAGRDAGDARIVTRSGETRWWNVVATAISRDRFLAFAEGISDRKRLEGFQNEIATAAIVLQSCTSESAVTGAPDLID